MQQNLSKQLHLDDKTQARRQIKPLKRENGQGSIYKSGPNQNQLKASIYDVHGKRITRTFKSRKDAENWLHEQRVARERGESTYAADTKSSVKDFLDFWLEQNKGNIAEAWSKSTFEVKSIKELMRLTEEFEENGNRLEP